MIRDIIYVKMPFRRGHWITEKNIPFLFKIMTLEMVADYLKIPMEDLLKEEHATKENMPLAMIWCGYLAACKELYKKPKYKESDAVKWNDFMLKPSREAIMKDISLLLGGFTEKKDKQKGEEESEKKK
jgi:hypothetical protein